MTKDSEKKQTIETYNKSALAHAEKFNKIGARTKDIEKAFSYISRPNPKVFEIGFGSGRDAAEIAKRTSDYLGIDLSSEMCKIAQRNVPAARFELADVETYQFPKGIDIIFAFASLLHSDKKGVANIINRACDSLNPAGVFFISTKYDTYHKKMIDKEGHGPKTYYFYTPEDIQKMCPLELKTVFQEIQEFKGQKWFSLILQKI